MIFSLSIYIGGTSINANTYQWHAYILPWYTQLGGSPALLYCVANVAVLYTP